MLEGKTIFYKKIDRKISQSKALCKQAESASQESELNWRAKIELIP